MSSLQTCRLRHLAYGGLLVGALSVISGCSTAPEKIPITTVSEAARQYFLKGRDLAEKLRLAKAEEQFKLALSEDSNFALAHLQLSFLQSNTADFYASFTRAKEQIEYVSKGERILILSVEAGVNSNATKQRDLLKKLVSQYPEDERAHNFLAGFYFGQQLYNLAIEEYTRAIEINPEFSAPYNQLGYAYRFLGRYDDAREIFGKYVELIPDDPNPYDSYAELLLKMGLFDESIESYRKALAIDTNFTASYVGIATNLMLQGNYEAAKEELDVMWQNARNYADRRFVYLERLIAYLFEGRIDSALNQFDRSIALADSTGDVAGVASNLISQGYILLEEGKHKEARRKFKRALTLVTESSLSKQFRDNAKRAWLFNAARADIEAGDLSSARSYASKFEIQVEVLQNPALTRTVHQLKGMIALARKEYETAVKELEQANQQDPYNLYRLARAHLELGNTMVALKLANESAHFNQVGSIQYALVRHKALDLLAELSRN